MRNENCSMEDFEGDVHGLGDTIVIIVLTLRGVVLQISNHERDAMLNGGNTIVLILLFDDT